MATITDTDLYEAPQAELTESAPEIKTSLFSPRGRMGVVKYMAHTCVLMMVMAAFFGVVAVSAGVKIGEQASSTAYNPLLLSLIVVAILPAIWIGSVMLIKRLHDLNVTGWLFALTAIPVLGAIISLFIMCAPGMTEANKFGPVAPTALWEKVLGIIGLALLIVGMVVSVGALVASFIMGIP